jgi:hypothetical protein
MANTFIELNDTPSDFTGSGLKFVRVNAAANELVFGSVELNDLVDVQSNLAYTPQGGQALIYSSAAGKWRPGTMDVYSAGNGLNKSALTLNVVAGTGGGLTSNTDGVYITDIAGVSGTWGNASHVPVLTINGKGQVTGVTPTLITAIQAQTITNPFVGNVIGTSGQIRVTGGTGNNSNATIDLVATGVTAATYGNTTHLPRITVDTYGRIQNVDLIEVAGGEGGTGTSLGFGNILVSGQTTISADQAADDVTFVAGPGVSITTQANADRITFSVDTSTVASSINLADLNDIDATGIVNGQVLIWNSSTNKFEAGTISGGGGNSNVDLTDFSIVTATPSGNGSLVYNNAGVFTFTPANVQASGSTQSLSWNSSTYSLSISGGNSVDLSVLKDNTDSQTLSLSGNVITISGSNSSVNLTSALGNVAGNYGDSNVTTLLGNVSANIIPSANNIYSLGSSSNRWKELHLSGNTIYIAGATVSGDSKLKYNGSNLATESYVTSVLSGVSGNYSDSNVAAYLSTNNYATQSYVTAQISALTAGASTALDTLAEVANALNNSNATLATVAFTGNYANLTNRPTLTLSSSNLTLDGTTVNLSSVIGQQGIQGNAGLQGNTGVSVTSATLSGSNLILTLSNASTIDAGNVRGAQGPQGLAGDGNAGIANATVAGNNNLIIGLVNGTYINAGNVKGSQGEQGSSGVGITSVSLVSSNLVLNYSNTSTQDVGNIRGPQGNAGTNGVSISTATVNGSGNLILTLSNASTVDAGNVRGTNGASGIQLSNLSVATAVTPSGNGSLSYNSSTGVFTFTPANLSSVQSNYGDSNVAAYLSANGYSNSDSDAQTLTLSGSNLSISGGNTVDLSSLGGGSGGIALTDLSGGTGISYSNVSGVIALANTAVTAGTYGSATKSPRITVDAQGRVTSVTEATITGGGGGSGGAKVERFKLNYNSSGALAGTANLSAGISNVTINSSSGGECTITFASGTYFYPPTGIMFYGYNYSANKYQIVPMETSMGFREIDGGGTAGSPTLFNGASQVVVKLRLREAETGASRGGFGTTTHAWIQFVMYD